MRACVRVCVRACAWVWLRAWAYFVCVCMYVCVRAWTRILCMSVSVLVSILWVYVHVVDCVYEHILVYSFLSTFAYLLCLDSGVEIICTWKFRMQFEKIILIYVHFCACPQTLRCKHCTVSLNTFFVNFRFFHTHYRIIVFLLPYLFHTFFSWKKMEFYKKKIIEENGIWQKHYCIVVLLHKHIYIQILCCVFKFHLHPYTIAFSSLADSYIRFYHPFAFITQYVFVWEVGGWGRDPKKCTGRDWVMGSSTI